MPTLTEQYSAGLGRRILAASGRMAVVVGLLALLAATGCQQPETCLTDLPDPGIRPQITIYEMANRLGLAVRNITGRQIEMSDQANRVVLLPTPGWAYVNNRYVGRFGRTYTTGGSLLVSPGLTDMLRRFLVESPTPSPTGPPQGPPPLPGLTSAFRIVIDAGHGGKDPGTTNRYGMQEKSVNLAVAQRLAARLRQQGAAVTMTREGDTFVELDDRAMVANRINAHLFVSVHADAAANRLARGYTVYVRRNAPSRCLQAAQAIERCMRQTGLPSRGVDQANYRVLKVSDGPAVLVELGYLSNSAEARLLASDSMQEQLGRCLAQGVIAFLQGQ